MTHGLQSIQFTFHTEVYDTSRYGTHHNTLLQCSKVCPKNAPESSTHKEEHTDFNKEYTHKKLFNTQLAPYHTTSTHVLYIIKAYGLQFSAKE